MSAFTRGFTGRPRGERDPRLPPGQYDARDQWPVLNAEVTPSIPTDTWSFTIEGLVERERTWTWEQIHQLAPSTYEGDIHCVTTWSKLGMTFTGVSVDTLLAEARVTYSAGVRSHYLGRLSRSQITATGENCRRISAGLQANGRPAKLGRV